MSGKVESKNVARTATEVAVQSNGVAVVTTDKINFIGATVADDPAGTAKVTILGVQFWTESESAATQQNTRWTPNNAAADVSAVIQPKGTGANLAQRPDGTDTGGNARGQYATDWQKIRTSNTHVASGNRSTISGGENNIASGAHAVVVGGRGNNATAQYSSNIGGNGSTASGLNSIVGSDQSTASGTQSICLGSESTASGTRSVVIGRQNVATVATAVAIGNGNKVDGINSFGNGAGSLVKNIAQRAFASSYNATGSADISIQSGRVQEGVSIMGFNSRLTGLGQPANLITTGQIFYLSLGNSGGYTPANVGWVPATANQQYLLQLKLSATITAITGTATGINVGDVKQWSTEGSGKYVASIITILNSGTTPVILYEDTGLATLSARFISVANRVVVEITAPTFVGGGSLEMMINGFMYYQEAALN